MPQGCFLYEQVSRNSVQGPSLAEENFVPEEKTNMETLIREAIQNVLDAKNPDLSDQQPVRLRLRLLRDGEFDRAYLMGLLGTDYSQRLQASGTEAPDLTAPEVLVIEDFGTTGLRGTTIDSNVDGPAENWNAFWFREGEGAKGTTGSNGRAGQGKITYYRLSGLRTIFGLTVREDQRPLLFGRSTLVNNYFCGDATGKWNRYAHWGLLGPDKQPLPVEAEAEIRAFSEAFHLERGHASGLSLVIPAPVDFRTEEAIEAAVQEFYLPILLGRLELDIDGIEIARVNVAALAEQYLPEAVEAQTGAAPVRTAGYRGFLETVATRITQAPDAEMPTTWMSQSTLMEDILPPLILAPLRARFDAGEPICVRFPVRISPVGSLPVYGEADVYLQRPAGLTHTQEVYMRRDLMISRERHLEQALTHARGLTYINHPLLSNFLAEAEEPTHLNWNGKRSRLVQKYKNPGITTLNYVRKAMPRLLRLLTGMVTTDNRHILSRYFPGAPAAEEAQPARTRAKKKLGRTNLPPGLVDPPRRQPARFRIVPGDTGENWIEVRSETGHPDDLPVDCVLELAYLNAVGIDPFEDYDPFDFDLRNTAEFPVEAEGILAGSLKQEGNRLSFKAAGADPVRVRVGGFDPNIRLQSRLRYREVKPDAEDQQEE